MTRAFGYFVTVTLLFMVASHAFAYTPVKAAAIPSATMMHVHIGFGDKAIDADITDSDEITGVLGFINAHLDGWKPVDLNAPIASLPTTEVNLRFFSGKNPIGTFGSDATFFTRGAPVTLTHSACAKEITDFLNLANIDPTKLSNPPHD